MGVARRTKRFVDRDEADDRVNEGVWIRSAGGADEQSVRHGHVEEDEPEVEGLDQGVRRLIVRPSRSRHQRE